MSLEVTKAIYRGRTPVLLMEDVDPEITQWRPVRILYKSDLYQTKQAQMKCEETGTVEFTREELDGFREIVLGWGGIDVSDLWPHQRQALNEIDQQIQNGFWRILVSAPTGSGKTRVMMERLLSKRKRTAIYTNRRMLLDQTSEKLHGEEISHGLIADKKEPRPEEGIQLAMIQSVHSRIKRSYGSDETLDELFKADEVFVDEAHNNSGPTSLDIFDRHKHRNPDVKIIGFSATPLGVSHAYDVLIQAGTNSELRDCGSHVKDGALYFAPDEPDVSLVGKVDTTGGETGISKGKRMRFTQRVFGRVVDHYHQYNPDRRPAILFAPGVEESKWFCQHLTRRGIKAAHIDSDYCMIGDGDMYPSTPEVKKEIERRMEIGEIHVVCNRFVLREGIDWTFLYHAIFATVFGGLTSYIQAGGRILRNHPGMDHVIIQDHGGNYWRHGSLNSDRAWYLNSNDRIEYQLRQEKLRKEAEKDRKKTPLIVCKVCGMVRGKHVLRCQNCGDSWTGRTRVVLQADGKLKRLENTAFKSRRYLAPSIKMEKRWVHRILKIMKSNDPKLTKKTFAEVYTFMAKENHWRYPPKTFELMPRHEFDWFLPIRSVPRDRLIQQSSIPQEVSNEQQSTLFNSGGH